jgi:CHASE2 domain-containing sensor protein
MMPSLKSMEAFSPKGYQHFCLALGISLLIAETIESIVDLFPGRQINFAVYNAWGFIVLNTSVILGKKLNSKKNYWFLNGFLTSAVILLGCAGLFAEQHWAYTIVYSVELIITLLVANHIRKYEPPQKFVELSKMRSRQETIGE